MIAAANRNPELRAACRFASLERHRTAHGYNITLQVFIGQTTLHF